MKGLLIDENLALPTALPTTLPVTHSRQLGSQPDDGMLWDHAKEHDLLIVTEDTDFLHRIRLEGPPPRVAHIRVGNMRRTAFITWLYKQWPAIELAASEHKLVHVHLDHLDAVS
jgi:predicted nuclease of predicted toxin-antitoxin system